MNNEFKSIDKLVGSNFTSWLDELKFFSMDDDDIAADMLILFAYIIFIQIIIAIVMAIKYRH